MQFDPPTLSLCFSFNHTKQIQIQRSLWVDTCKALCAYMSTTSNNNILYMELFAILQGIKIAKNKGATKIQINTGAKDAVEIQIHLGLSLAGFMPQKLYLPSNIKLRQWTFNAFGQK